MNNSWRDNKRIILGGGLAFAFLVGFVLRWYLFADEVFADDEWHGFYYALGKSPGWLLTHFSIPGATCIPLNFYTWVLGHSLGWSEWLLRLPSLICGLLCLLIFPWLAHPFIGPRRTVLLSFLLAISPLLIFYSRICRPYSAVAFLAFASLLLAARWQQRGEWRAALLFIVTGALAVYFHLFAAVTVAAPLFAALIAFVWSRRAGATPANPAGPTLYQWFVAGLIMAGFGAILVLPALIHSLQSTFFQVALKGNLEWRTLPQMLLLVSGTGQPLLAALFWFGVIAGAAEQCRRNAWLGWTLVSLFPLHMLALVLSRPDAAQSAIVLTRYCIPLVPVCLFLAACGIHSILEALATRARLQPVLQTVIAAVCVAALAFAGPLPQCYMAPNNFTSHGAYQHHYGIIDWHRSFQSDITPKDFPFSSVIGTEEVSPFYQILAHTPDNRPIVEYPMLIGDHFNLLYYYQHFHHRPVIVGYSRDIVTVGGLPAGNIFGNTYIDEILGLVPDQSQLRFHNLVYMEDLTRMRDRHVEYIVLHKEFGAQISKIVVPIPNIPRLTTEYSQALGKPCYEDNYVIVFRL